MGWLVAVMPGLPQVPLTPPDDATVAVGPGGELTVLAWGIVSGLGMAVPTDCCGAFPAFDNA